ncbi:hypothetical protein O1L68_15050 [Streptomyces lydicus]|nr:hypothetical protein [Streptomyces lydicus]
MNDTRDRSGHQARSCGGPRRRRSGRRTLLEETWATEADRPRTTSPRSRRARARRTAPTGTRRTCPVASGRWRTSGSASSPPRGRTCWSSRGTRRRPFHVRPCPRHRGTCGREEVSFLVCDPEDGRRPLLLALRLVKALAPHRQSPPRPRRADGGAADALAAVERGEPAAMGRALVAALAQSAP